MRGGYGTCVKSAVVALTSAPQLSAINSQIISMSASFIYASHVHVV